MHHVWARGVNRRKLFRDDEDYERYIRMLGATVGEKGWICLTFCLLPNHVHLLIETPTPNLGEGMQRLHSDYALTFNERHDLRGQGHVFQGPYGSERVDDELYFLRVSAYVIMNAVVAKLCSRPEEWPWSGHGMIDRGIRLPWLAHDLFNERLRDVTGRDDFVSTIVL